MKCNAVYYDRAYIVGRLRACRKDAGLIQREVAERMGICTAGYRRVENCAGGLSGKGTLPTLQTLARVADALGIHLFELLGSEGQNGKA